MENLQMEILMGKSSNYKWRNFRLPFLITGGYSSGLFANFPQKNLISIVLAKQWSLKPTLIRTVRVPPVSGWVLVDKNRTWQVDGFHRKTPRG